MRGDEEEEMRSRGGKGDMEKMRRRNKGDREQTMWRRAVGGGGDVNKMRRRRRGESV